MREYRKGLSQLRLIMICTGVIITLVMGLAPALAEPSRQTATAAALRLAMVEPQTLDPVQVSRFDANTRDLVENLFVGLTRFDPVTRQAEPMLAKSWTISPNGLTWTFELRDDIQWVQYDSTSKQITAVRPVTAGDFVYAIQRACDPLRPSPVTANLMVIDGCMTVANAAHSTIDDLYIARTIGVRTTSPTTLEIQLVFPTGYLPALLSTPEFRPLPREAVSDTANWTVPQTMLSSGPYSLTAWTQTGMELTRNPFWPDDYAGNIEAISVNFTNEAASLASSGQIDMIRLTSDEIAAARVSSPQLLKIAEGSSLVTLGFSFDRTMVSTPEVRRALSMALDRSALVAQLLPDQAQAANTFTPAGVIAAPTVETNLYDPAQAQANYSAAGFPACEGVQEKMIMLVPDDNPLWAQLGQAIINQWSATLGCNPALFEVQTLARPLLIELAHSAYDYEKITRSHLWLAVWSADYPDANAWLNDALYCLYGYLRTGRECEQADAEMDKAAVETDPVKRAEFYTQIEQMLFGPMGSYPVIPLYRTTSAWLQQPWLSGVNEIGAARFDLWTVDTAQRP
ncbi:MAG: peptide ABC transporter substrate-binding protein [Chloroflexi bacterium]|nr:peptide ABC transporter substrate-binding protein [Chloroflexota bacterium]